MNTSIRRESKVTARPVKLSISPDGAFRPILSSPNLTRSVMMTKEHSMNARTCLLTHFSQRYPKLPHLGAALTEKSSLDVALAFDMMRLRVGDAWKARHYFAPMSALLRELDPKAAKKEAVRMQTD